MNKKIYPKMNKEHLTMTEFSNEILPDTSGTCRAVLTALSLIMALMLPAGIQGQSIQQYQQEAARNNPEVKAAFSNYLSALQESPQAAALPDPELAFGYFISPIETRVGPQKARISVSQMFPWFGTLKDRRDLSESRARAKFEMFQQSRNRIFLEVETVLLKLYELDESIRIAKENLSILNSLVEISLRRYETSQATQVDVLRAQIEQEDLKTKLELLNDNREVLHQKISELLNREVQTDIQLPDSLPKEYPTTSLDDLYNKALLQNPGLKNLEFREESSKKMKELAVNEGRPSFGVGIDYIFTESRNDLPSLKDNGKDAILARASFRIPLFRNKYKAKVRQAELDLSAVQHQLEAEKNELRTALQSAIRDMDDARRRYRLYDFKQIQRVNQALSIMMEAYSSDSSDFEEILRMQRKLLSYQLSRIQSLTDLHSSGAYLDYLYGRHNIQPEEVL